MSKPSSNGIARPIMAAAGMVFVTVGLKAVGYEKASDGFCRLD